MTELSKHLIPVSEVRFPDEFTTKQMDVFWTPTEIKVEKDIQDIRVRMSVPERNGTISTLKLFSLYETHAGDEYWGGRFKTMFNDSGFHKMGATFAFFELAVHAPFYKKINELLALDSEDFYRSYAADLNLVNRMEHIDEIINHPSDLVSLAGFSMVEGVILYSSFAYLKHFQSQGKNLLTNVVRGLNFSVRDENLHSVAGATSFKYLAKKLNYTDVQMQGIEFEIRKLAETLYSHECAIIGQIFSYGEQSINEEELKTFVKSRINTCLMELGFDAMYTIESNPVADWFYKGINSYQFNDFFSGQGREYVRSWNEDGFNWKVRK